MAALTYLVAYDFSDNADKVLDYAVDLAQKCDADLKVVHVVDTPTFPITLANYDDLVIELQELSQKKMDEVRERLKECPVPIQTVVLNGVPGEEILKYVENNKIDMIFLGTHGHSKLENFLFGNTAEAILRKAQCPVVSLRI